MTGIPILIDGFRKTPKEIGRRAEIIQTTALHLLKLVWKTRKSRKRRRRRKRMMMMYLVIFRTLYDNTVLHMTCRPQAVSVKGFRATRNQSWFEMASCGKFCGCFFFLFYISWYFLNFSFIYFFQCQCLFKKKKFIIIIFFLNVAGFIFRKFVWRVFNSVILIIKKKTKKSPHSSPEKTSQEDSKVQRKKHKNTMKWSKW